jgi:hypothetical protein
MDLERDIYEQALSLAIRLSPAEKAQLLQAVSATLQQDLIDKPPHKKSPQPVKQSLQGLWADIQLSENDIDDGRREMLDNFPREDIV